MNVKSFLLLLFLSVPYMADCQLIGYAESDYAADKADATDARIHLHVDLVPLFDGCYQPNVFTLELQVCSLEKVKSFIRENMQYPAEATAAGLTSGKVRLRAIIETDGTVSGARIISADHASFETEAVRLVKAMPKWRPAKLKEQTVRAFHEMIIDFDSTK